jgi:hypothetical protein
MPFIKIVRFKGRSSHDFDGITMGAHLQGSENKRGLYISISRSVLERTTWSPINRENKVSYRITIQEGVGAESGFLQLVEDVNGYMFSTSSKNTKLGVSAGIYEGSLSHYVLNEVPVAARPIDFSVEDDGATILLQCPDWLRYNPLSYDEATGKVRTKAEQELLLAQPPPTPKKVDVIVEDVRFNRGDRRRIASRIAQELKK